MKIIRIGRDQANDRVIHDPLVSRSHCQIIQDEYGGFTIIDSSTNGTFVNGERIGKNSKSPLHKNDIVRIGNAVLPWQTYFNDIGETKSRGTEMWYPQKNIVKIGRGTGNDIIINDRCVSSFHCQIIQEGYGSFSIIDNSRNGTFVNGVQICKGFRTQLNRNDIIRIGNTTLPWQTYFSSCGGTGMTPISEQLESEQPKPEQKSGLGIVALVLSIIGAALLMYSAIRIMKWGIFAWMGNASTFALVSFGINIIACILAGIADYNEYKDSNAAEIAEWISGFCIVLEIGFYLYLRFGDPNLLNPFKNMFK